MKSLFFKNIFLLIFLVNYVYAQSGANNTESNPNLDSPMSGFRTHQELFSPNVSPLGQPSVLGLDNGVDQSGPSGWGYSDADLLLQLEIMRKNLGIKPPPDDQTKKEFLNCVQKVVKRTVSEHLRQECSLLSETEKININYELCGNIQILNINELDQFYRLIDKYVETKISQKLANCEQIHEVNGFNPSSNLLEEEAAL